MSYTINGDPVLNINFAPATVEEEIIQNVKVLLSTAKFTVPLDRGLGLEQRFVDKPINIAQTLVISEVLDAVEQYEPRVKVISVSSDISDITGKLIAVAEVEINA